MDGFLTNDWRDLIAMVGFALALAQSIPLFKDWVAKRRATPASPSPVHHLSNSAHYPTDRTSTRPSRAIWLAIAILTALQIVLNSLLSFNNDQSGDPVIYIASSTLLIFCIMAHEVLLFIVFRRLTALFISRVAVRKFLSSFCLGCLFFVSALLFQPLDNVIAAWLPRLANYYAGGLAGMFIPLLLYSWASDE
jgi:hypothetical protein